MSKNSECVKVMVRVRPLNKKEISGGNHEVVSVDTKFNQINLQKPESPEISKDFAYDSVFGTDSTQQLVYNE